MKFFARPIFTGFMPNLLFHDVVIASSFLFPWKWKNLKNGEQRNQLERELQHFFDTPSATLFDSGRTALQIALEVLGVQTGDEVLVQAYTCSVVSNAIIWAKATPVYVDITDEYILDLDDLGSKITARTKVIIVQHTFGIPAHILKIGEIAKKHNIKVIEDCAHTMGVTVDAKLLGTIGDIGMLSFGADKPISCGRGGALLTQNPDLSKKIQDREEMLPHTPTKKILQQLVTFKLFFLFKPLYNIGVGKLFLALCKKIHLLSRIIEQSEKIGQKSKFYPAKLSNALASVALHQLYHLDTFNKHRAEVTKKYFEGIRNSSICPSIAFDNLPLLRFPLQIKNPKKLHQMAQKQGILLGDWYNTVIAPKDVDFEKIGYTKGMCPKAESLACQSINLPTDIHIDDQAQKKIIELVNSYDE